jgi:hypothetical protein
VKADVQIWTSEKDSLNGRFTPESSRSGMIVVNGWK